MVLLYIATGAPSLGGFEGCMRVFVMPKTSRGRLRKTPPSSANLHEDYRVNQPTLQQQNIHPIAQGVAALIFSLMASQAAAIGLGGIHVHSYLGEALRADVEVTALSAEEEESLQIELAGADSYQGAGLQMHEALLGATVRLQRYSNGKPYISIRGKTAVQEPFVDLMLRTNTNNGGYGTRGYTVLIDPPTLAGKLQQPEPVSVQAPVYSMATPPPVAAQPTAAPVAQAQQPTVAVTSEPVAAARPAPKAQRRAAAPQRQMASSAATSSVRVQRGDTAGAIAQRLAAQQGVSFDQMLAALLRQNESAFIQGNVHRVKAGAVLQVPTQAEAQSVSRSEAREQWVSSGQNFGEYRRKLARVQQAPVQESSSRVGGKVEVEAKDQTPRSQAQDKLTIGKADKKRAYADEEALRKRQEQEARSRVGELSRNIDELKKLAEQAESGTAGKGTGAGEGAGIKLPASMQAAVQSNTQSAEEALQEQLLATQKTLNQDEILLDEDGNIVTLVEPEGVLADIEGLNDGESGEAVAEDAAEGAEPTPSASATPVATAAAQDEPTLADKIKGWMLPWGAAGLGVLALGGIGLAARRRRKVAEEEGQDVAFLESKLDAESYFDDALAAQRVDTSEHGSVGGPSSMVYSPSQLDAAGDVDPVAEAGVYMAYNRDDQAEEILKEAMRQTPTRAAIYTTLMEIYARRGDVKAFNVVGREAYHLTGAQGPDWTKAAALGQSLDPSNPMYASGHAAGHGVDTQDAAAFDPAEQPPSMTATAPMPLESAQATARLESEDLDMPLEPGTGFGALSGTPEPESYVVHHQATTPMELQAESEAAAPNEPTVVEDSDFDLNFAASEPPVVAAAPHMDSLLSGEGRQTDEDFSFDDAPLNAPNPEPALSFDLSDVSLDLGESVGPDSQVPDFDLSLSAEVGEDLGPWETKLELARESLSVGDVDGARVFAEEVAAAAPADLAQQAQALLDSMA